ncbi:hypothetical protein [Burkholderia territorii]|uniref:hypothetical protein n=1 Tax=Burkholderia territorii TaxID=1503055 RepID=UPI0012D97882|nr:hypothetical protein [Burkholderia territorii]
MKHSVFLTGRRCAERTSGDERHGFGKIPRKFFRALAQRDGALPACGAAHHAYIKSETFCAARRNPIVGRFDGTLAAPGFPPRWPALCVKVRTTVDDVTSDRLKQQADKTGLNHLRKATDRGRVGEYAAQALNTAETSTGRTGDGIVRAKRIT